MLQQFKKYITDNHLFNKGDHLLLAVSGGVDSVLLCELIHRLGYRFSIAHCNFQLRGEESNRDEAFVRSLAASYGVAVYIKQFNTQEVAATEKKSIETTARDLRYAWFNTLLKGDAPEVSKEQIPAVLLTAHHADDNIETVVMNFFRGTGIAGLKGIQPRNGRLVRPLLFARRTAIEQFAAENNLQFVTDSTNAETVYTRNLFRNKILPLVNEVYPSADKNLLHNIGRLADAESLYNEAVALHLKKLLHYKGNEVHVPVRLLQQTPGMHAVIFEMIRKYGFTAQQVEEVAALLQSETGKYIQSASHRIIKNRHWLIIAPNATREADHVVMEEGQEQVVFGGGKISVRQCMAVDKPLKDVSTTAVLDASKLEFPLILRRWETGDYFYPLGMKHKKKLSRFFIDQKLSLTEKENAWVIEMDKKIIWVVGMRIDDRFKITPSTIQTTVISLETE